ncbi:MAG: hypothetical protein GX306_13140 [Clostridiales bacterium]|jgi:hypothetical protein|nr:hypothetical protein [Clostridiales bacterium]
MGFFNKLLDWAADKVQTATGEKERRQLVQELKDQYEQFKIDVERIIASLNRIIEEFNEKVRYLNTIRKGVVEKNIHRLSDFLGKFGRVKEVGEYSKETEKQFVDLPEQQFERTENYISEVDWSKDDVFINTFFLSPIGMKLKTRKQNLAMRESLHEFQLEAEETINQLKMRTFSIQLDKQICDLYIECVEFISNYIVNIILPELELVEAFFQALKIKDEVIADQKLHDLRFKNEIDLLQDTVYEKHYMFIKNAFMFYIISCKIYNTPVLTRLLNNQTSNEDIGLLEDHKEILAKQGQAVRNNLIINR